MSKEWNGKRLKSRYQVDPEEYGESLTVQSDMLGTDIRNILNKYTKGLFAQDLDTAELKYMDVSQFTDFADVMREAKKAEYDFMKLPSKFREIFHHDVAEFLDTAHDPEKRDALVKAGFLEPSEMVAPASDVGALPASDAVVGDGGET